MPLSRPLCCGASVDGFVLHVDIAAAVYLYFGMSASSAETSGFTSDILLSVDEYSDVPGYTCTCAYETTIFVSVRLRWARVCSAI